MKTFAAAAIGLALFAGPSFAVTVGDLNSDIDGELSALFSQSVESEQTLVGGTPSTVPLPAAGWMLLAGVGGLVALRRRARA